MSATSEHAYGPPPKGGFYAYRPIVVPVDLDTLDGPLEGVVTLPSYIDTSARVSYDLADHRDREILYRIVILEAWKEDDFAVWLNRDALLVLWPDIQLPGPVRAKWENCHPVLVRYGAGVGVPRPQLAIDAYQAAVARIALGVAAEHGFALAGGNALIAHGIVQRHTEDVDLFSPEPGGPGAVAYAVRDALDRAGYHVEFTRPPEAHGGEFARLEVTRGGETMHLDLARDWRKGQPVQLAVGPVLQLDDAVSSKVNAMVTRRLPRDFIDVAASLKRYTRSQLMRLAFGRDPGLRVIDFTDAARELDRLTIDVFRKYGLDDHAVTALRDAFADWPRNENDDEDGQAIHAVTAG